MSGVEVLAVERVAVAFGFDWSAFIFLGLVLGLLFSLISLVIAMTLDCSDLSSGAFAVLGVLVGWALAALLASISISGPPTEFESHCKVTISDEVLMNEFLERYEIIDQEDRIFTVREIEDGK